jgi:ATP-dependent RNA helicase MSS116
MYQVNQMYMVAPLDLHFSIIYGVLKKHVAEDAEYKVSYLASFVLFLLLRFLLTKVQAYIFGFFWRDIAILQVIIFCTTAMVTKLVAEILSQLKLNVREIHSRKTQSARTKVSDEFRRSKGLILVSSDVSARGVDYPDVSLVVQVGSVVVDFIKNTHVHFL